MLAAVKTKDDVVLKALASKDDPDPWLVADELVSRGQLDAAQAFASASPRPDVEALPAYVAERTGKADDAARRAIYAQAVDAMIRKDAAGALEMLGAPAPAARDVVGVRTWFVRAGALNASKRMLEAANALVAAADEAERLGWLARAARALGDAADREETRSPARASSLWDRAIAIEERRGNRHGLAVALRESGTLAHYRGETDVARTKLDHALVLADEVGDARSGTAARLALANLNFSLGSYDRAVKLYREAIERSEAVGDAQAAAAALSNLGRVHFELSEYDRALDCYERALATMDRLGDRLNAARTRAKISSLHTETGSYAKALEQGERALATMRAAGQRADVGRILIDLGVLNSRLGDPLRAIECYEDAFRSLTELGDRASAAITLGNLGSIYYSLGEHEKARDHYERWRAAAVEMGDRSSEAIALGNLGSVHHALRQDAKALEFFTRGLAMNEALGLRSEVVLSWVNLATVLAGLGRRDEAFAYADRALKEAERLRGPALIADALHAAAEVRDSFDDAAGALPLVRRAVDVIGTMLGGLGEQQGATARTRYLRFFELGVQSAATLGDASEATFFLESGRATALLEALGGREAMRRTVLPQALRVAAASAETAEAAAVVAYREALDAGDRDRLRVHGAALDAARALATDVFAQIQREAKRAAQVVYPTVDSLDRIRERLATGDAYVAYALFRSQAFALVATRERGRIVRLGETERIAQACSLLAAHDRSADATAAVDALRSLVVTPLALERSVRRVVVSPDGALSYVPFTMLLGPVDVALIPSGTTYGHLADERPAIGTRVLALGDPVYSGPRAPGTRSAMATARLSPLPGTREEAKAIGDVVLLGADATESRLRAEIATRARWRSVHLACHGIVDPDRPLDCALALTPGGDDDGFLVAREVFQATIPSDLVVLSACETGRGKIVAGEGVLGLTRAFMYAGSPRVIVSLWKVDDEATRALMVKFYELWNPRDGKPGLPTATALKQAQEFVRSHGKWKHPYYWAAWVLWGLPS